jgi:hypothetical protein
MTILCLRRSRRHREVHTEHEHMKANPDDTPLRPALSWLQTTAYGGLLPFFSP